MLCVRVCVWGCEGERADRLFAGWGWLTGWWEDNMLRTVTEWTWNSFTVTIMNLKENPCVCLLAIEAGWDDLRDTVSHRCPSLKDCAAPDSFLSHRVVISTAVRACMALGWAPQLSGENKVNTSTRSIKALLDSLRINVQFSVFTSFTVSDLHSCSWACCWRSIWDQNI